MTVEIENLHVAMKKSNKELLHDVSFSIHDTDRLALIGESGSGKSLTALAMLGLLPSTMQQAGRISINGVDMIHASEAEKNQVRGKVVSIVYQEPRAALDPLMKVGKQIAEPLHRYQKLTGGDLEKELARLLHLVQLDDVTRIKESYPSELSGGQLQRIAIAMALSCKPSLLIADEPTTALDVTIQKEILQLLDSLIETQHMALLFITHDLAVAEQVSSEMLIMKNGLIVERGKTSEIIHNPKHEYTQRLFKASVAVSSLPF